MIRCKIFPTVCIRTWWYAVRICNRTFLRALQLAKTAERTLSCGNTPLNGNGAGSTILLLTSAVSPQRLFVRREYVKEPKTQDDFLKVPMSFNFPMGKFTTKMCILLEHVLEHSSRDLAKTTQNGRKKTSPWSEGHKPERHKFWCWEIAAKPSKWMRGTQSWIQKKNIKTHARSNIRRVYMYAYNCLFKYIYIYVYMYICMCIFIYMYRCIYVYMYMYIFVYRYMCIYICIYIHVYIYMYMYIYIYKFRFYIYMFICISI